MKTNTITLGDNLELLRELPTESIDLICTDPPFNKGKDFFSVLTENEFEDKFDNTMVTNEDRDLIRRKHKPLSLIHI